MVLAPIERLPVELLQEIFIASNHDVAIIKASPYIAARLSSEYIYHSICDYHLTEVRDNRGEQSTAQTFMFASNWMTWAFFKTWILRRFGPNGCLCGQTQDEGCFDAQWPPNFEDATKLVFSRSHLPRLAFVKARMPIKLLCGPWTQDKIEFLRFLLWITSMSVDWNDCKASRAAVEGRRQAMLERNLEAVELFNHNRRLGRAADLDTVRFAVVDADCDRSCVYDTLLAANMWNTRGRFRHSAELHSWCEARMAEGDPKGAWLRNKMDESRIFSTEREAEQENEHSHKRTGSEELDPDAGAYNGGVDDGLTVHQLEWNKNCLQQGWFYRRGGIIDRYSTHYVEYVESGAFRHQRERQRQLYVTQTVRHRKLLFPAARLHMYAPCSKDGSFKPGSTITTPAFRCIPLSLKKPDGSTPVIESQESQ